MRHTIPVLTAILVAVAANGHAAKDTFERTKPHVNVGTIGHLDQQAARALKASNAQQQTVPEHN